MSEETVTLHGMSEGEVGAEEGGKNIGILKSEGRGKE